MTRIVDASVLVKMLCEEPGTFAARRLFVEHPDLIAPDLAVPEAFNALWKKSRAGLYGRDQLELVPAFLSEILSRQVVISHLVERAASLSITFQHPIYDCIYLALSEREHVPLVSADQRLIEVGRRAGLTIEALEP